jgi:hypothetical protein
MIGKTILHYKILEKLGEGGMSSFSEEYNKLSPHAGGVVYKAEDTKSKSEAGIKTLPLRTFGEYWIARISRV